MFRVAIVFTVLLCQMNGQSGSFPLESVSVEGTTLSKDAVLNLAGLHIGSPIDKSAIEAASQKLNESGMFESVNYRYAQAPKQGYALTLMLADPRSLFNATIDIPGVNEDELWRWLSSTYPLLNHKVPANEAAQRFVSRKLEDHLGPALEGHHIVGQLETEFGRGNKSSISFRPDPLPRITALNFKGQSELTSDQLAALIPADMKEQGYTDRTFQRAVDLNLRRAYEERGMYRVRFPSLTAQKEPGWSVSVTTAIEEGPKFSLGEVQLVDDKLPVEAMFNAAKFRKGQIANWTEIQSSIWELEKPVKRLGYLDARVNPERVLDDNRHILDLRISVNLGPLYRFGQLRITGLPPDLEAQARKIWRLNEGDPFDYDYPKDFFQAFFRSVDSRQFKKFNVKMQKSSRENVMDFAVFFEPR